MYVLFLLTILFVHNEAARILAVFPVPAISHQVVFRPLTQELAKRGHEVLVITPYPAFKKGETPANLTEIDVNKGSVEIWRRNIVESDVRDLTTQFQIFMQTNVKLMEYHIKHVKEVQDLIKSDQKFDLLFLEACTRSALGYSHLYKVPVIQISSFGTVSGNYETVGAPDHPILYGNSLRQRLHNLSMWEKLEEVYKYLLYQYMAYIHEDIETKSLRKLLGDDVPSIGELLNNVHMLFLNKNQVFEGIRPVPPTVVFMGGIHQNPVKDLPKDLKATLDSSKHGVIYISFGTSVSTTVLSPEKVQILVKVLSKLPYDVLWKWDADELPGRSENIKIAKWFPQSDLLRHPKVKLFITQGGLQSTDEALAGGVPLIGVPLLGDQWYNVEKYVEHKIGVRIDLDTVTEEQFRNAVTTVIGDESYRRNTIKLHKIMIDQPQRPLERAVWWTEYVLRHGGAAHLRSPAANISWAQFLELELFLTVVSVALGSLTVILFALNKLYRICFGKPVRKNKND